MSAWLIENMAPLMFASMMLVLLIGYPVAFALSAVGIGFGLLGIELGLLTPALFQAMPERLFGVMSNDTRLAIPFFTFTLCRFARALALPQLRLRVRPVLAAAR